MNLTQLSSILGKVYNRLGNKYLTDNFITEPFDFKVKVRYGEWNEYYDYIIEIESTPDIPKSFRYKPEVKKEKNKWADGIDISVLKHEFKEIYKYVDMPPKSVEVKFVNKII